MIYYLPYEAYDRNGIDCHIRINIFNPKHWIGVFGYFGGINRDTMLWYASYTGPRNFDNSPAAMEYLDNLLLGKGHYLIQQNEVERFKKLMLLT